MLSHIIHLNPSMLVILQISVNSATIGKREIVVKPLKSGSKTNTKEGFIFIFQIIPKVQILLAQ